MHGRRTVRARRRPAAAADGRQLHAPQRLRYPLGQLTKTCNLTHLWLHSGPPTATYSTWTVQRKRTVQKRFGRAPEAPLERPASPRTASGGGAEPSSHAWSGGKPPHKRSIASAPGATPTLRFISVNRTVPVRVKQTCSSPFEARRRPQEAPTGFPNCPQAPLRAWEASSGLLGFMPSSYAIRLPFVRTPSAEPLARR